MAEQRWSSLGDALGALGAGATFPLMEDPRQTNRALLIGMFVLRPAAEAWDASLGEAVPEALRSGQQWCFNVKASMGAGLLPPVTLWTPIACPSSTVCPTQSSSEVIRW